MRSSGTVRIGLCNDIRHFNETLSRVKSAVERANKLEGESVGRSIAIIAERSPGSQTLIQVVSIGSVPMISQISSRYAQDATKLRIPMTTLPKEVLDTYPHKLLENLLQDVLTRLDEDWEPTRTSMAEDQDE